MNIAVEPWRLRIAQQAVRWTHYLTFSHVRNTWLAGHPGYWTQITAGTARRLVDAGWRVLDI